MLENRWILKQKIQFRFGTYNQRVGGRLLLSINFVLTYMSIYDFIGLWVDEGRLFDLPLPAELRIPVVRRIVIAKPIVELINGPWETEEWAERCGLLHGDLVKFVSGARLQVASKPYHGKTSYLLRLDPEPEEVWEIRCRDPEQIRVFGRFVRKDYFVALLWEFRADLKEPHKITKLRRPLTPDDFPDVWRAVRVQCKTEWNNLFPSCEPLSGVYPDDYLSNAVLV